MDSDSLAPGFLVTLLHPPRHVDALLEFSNTAQLADGVILHLDIELSQLSAPSLPLSSEIALSHALGQLLTPILVLTDISDLLTNELLSSEEIYQTLKGIIEKANECIAFRQPPSAGDKDWQDFADADVLNPSIGNVVFGSDINGWGFSLTSVAKRYGSQAQKKDVDIFRAVERLWGEPSSNDADEARGTRKRKFNALVLEPLLEIFKITLKGDIASIRNLIADSPLLRPSLPIDEQNRLLAHDNDREYLLRQLLYHFFPMDDAILEAVILCVPSPPRAQIHRVKMLYEGPQDDQFAQAIRDCDPDGPLMVHIGKIVHSPALLPNPSPYSTTPMIESINYFEKQTWAIPTEPTSTDELAGEAFYALARVFSGTLHPGMNVRILGPKYIPGRKEDTFQATIGLDDIVSLVDLSKSSCDTRDKGDDTSSARDSNPPRTLPKSTIAGPGNIILLRNIPRFLTRSGTLTGSANETAHPFRIQVHPIARAPLVQRIVELRGPSTLLMLHFALNRLVRLFPGIEVLEDSSGQQALGGVDEKSLEECVEVGVVSNWSSFPLSPH